jgi:1,4-alpha-glucan branching enzyme
MLILTTGALQTDQSMIFNQKTTMKPRLKKSNSLPMSAGGHPKVRFSLRWVGARSVAVAGSFNDWLPTNCPMTFDGKDTWHAELELTPGSYEYRFIVDGEWCDDPEAMRRVSNPFGSVNAVRVVECVKRATSSRG